MGILAILTDNKTAVALALAYACGSLGLSWAWILVVFVFVKHVESQRSDKAAEIQKVSAKFAKYAPHLVPYL